MAQLRTPSATGSLEPISPHRPPAEPELVAEPRAARSHWSSSVLVVAAIVVGLAGALVISLVLLAFAAVVMVRSRKNPVHAGNVNDEWDATEGAQRTPAGV